MPLVISRVGCHGGQPSRLHCVERRGTDAEVVTRRSLAAEHTVAPLDDVEVELEDAPLVEDRLEHYGDQRFLGLAPVTPLRRKEEVFRQLLADRRAPGDDTA